MSIERCNRCEKTFDTDFVSYEEHDDACAAPLKAEHLDQFTGTIDKHRFSALFGQFLLTDGAKYLADKAGAYWLMDIIASARGYYRDHHFVSVQLSVEGSNWLVIITDGNDNALYMQSGGFTDFPLGDIKLFTQFDGRHWTIMLPSEY